MRIFITGSTGFIGKYVLSKINNGKHQILALTRNPKNLTKSADLKIIKGDLSNPSQLLSALKKFKPDVAIHLAWNGIPDLGIENSIKNLEQGLNLIKLLSKTSCRTIVATGSLWEYGNQKGKIAEDTPSKSFNAFTTSKNALLLLGIELANSYKINFVWTRIFYVYGPGQKSSSLIPYLIDCAKNGKTPEIKNPLAENDFVYVEDVADAISKILFRCKKSSTYNIGSGKLTSVQKIIDIIFKKFSGSNQFRKKQAKQTDIVSSFYADISKIEKEIGWKPKTNIEQGIKKTIAYSSR